MKFKNLQNGELVNICGIKADKQSGQIVSAEVGGRPEGPRFCAKWSHVITEQHDEQGAQFFTVNEGWEQVKGERKQREPKPKTEKAGEPKPKKARAKKASAKKVSTKVAEPTAETEMQEVETAQPMIEDPEVKKELELYALEMGTNIPLDPAVVKAELEAKYGEMGSDMFKYVCALAGMAKPAVEASEAKVDEAKVRTIVDEYFEKKKAEVKVIEVKSPRGIGKVEGVTNKDFTKFCNLVNAGKPLYMYGPAGSGKSYTAKQIAESLKLDYYETSQALFAHELKGYGDAGGRFVETAFYRAFANGGVFFLDEVDASAPEALVVLNNAIANGRFDFPVVGNVNAHPNFRVVAAGNTRMTGATMEYTARQMQDTSFKNRFFFAMVTYDEKIFLNITGGDKEIVEFGADLRRAARETGISQLFSYRQAKDLATLQECCEGDEVYLLRGSVLQEKEIDDTINLYERLRNKNNRWAKAMKAAIEQMRTEEVW